MDEVDLNTCVAIYVDAKNDRVGNPRRGWWVVDDSAGSVVFVDEGYGGQKELSRVLGRDLPRTGQLRITPAAYRSLKTLFSPGAPDCRWVKK